MGCFFNCWLHLQLFLSAFLWNYWTPTMWMWIPDNIMGSHFWTKFWRASTTLTCPSGSILTVFHRNRASWEIIDGGAQYILKGRSGLGRNDHPIKPKPKYMWNMLSKERSINEIMPCNAVNSLVNSDYASNRSASITCRDKGYNTENHRNHSISFIPWKLAFISLVGELLLTHGHFHIVISIKFSIFLAITTGFRKCRVHIVNGKYEVC